MTTSWLLYYVMVISHLCGLTYAFLFGRAVHRAVALLIACTALIQVAACEATFLARLPIKAFRVTIDTADNIFMCAGLLAVSLIYKHNNWVIALMMLAATQLALNSLVFQDGHGVSQADFPGTANAVSILMISVLVAALVRRDKVPERPAFRC